MDLLMMAMLLSASDIGPAKKIELLMVPSEVYWASYRASGAKLCDKKLRESQERQFNRRYGIRVSKLISIIAAKEQEKSQDDDLIVTSDCVAFRDRDAGRNALSRALGDFEPALAGMERRYGIGGQ